MKTKEKESPLKLWITYSQSEEGGGVCEGDDSDWPMYEDTYISTNFDSVAKISVERPKDKFFSLRGQHADSFDVPEGLGDKVYFAVVSYSDGDSFSHTKGYIQLEGPFLTREEAIKAEKVIYDSDKDPNITWVSGYRWTGYFASLDDVSVKEFTVSR